MWLTSGRESGRLKTRLQYSSLTPLEREGYECIKSFCYLGDNLDGDGGADLAATARNRNGWMKFREHLRFLTFRAPPLEMKGSSVCQLCQKLHDL